MLDLLYYWYSVLQIFLLIQNPVTVLTVRYYCGKFFAPPEKSKKTHSFFLRFLDLLGLRLNLLSLGSSCSAGGGF